MRPLKHRVCLTVTALLLGAGGCSGFETIADGGPDARADVMAPDLGGLDGSDGPDLPAPDQGPDPPADSPCGLDYWVKGTKSDPSCAPRHVQLVEVGPNVRQIAVSFSAGQVGIAYGVDDGFEASSMHLVAFARGAASLPAAQVVTSVDVFGSLARRVALAPASAGGFHLGYLEVTSQGSELDYAFWSGSSKPTPAERVSPDVAGKGSVDLVEGSDGRVHVAYYEDLARRYGLRSRPKGGGTWSAPIHFDSDVDSTVYRHGHVALVRHSGGGPAFAYHMGFKLTSQPRFRRWDPISALSSTKTIDNATAAGVVGGSIDLVVTADEQVAAYFAVPSGAQTAELRLARWASFNDPPQITVLDQAIPLGDPSPEYELAMAVDRWGLLHLAILSPSSITTPNVPRGVLEYRRQIRVGGQTKWLTDIVDDQVMGDTGGAHVALFVEPDGRPHIAYVNSYRAEVRYATRTDR